MNEFFMTMTLLAFLGIICFMWKIEKNIEYLKKHIKPPRK